MNEINEFPGLAVLARQAFDRAREGTPPDVGIAVLFAFHYGPAGSGGLGWVAGMEREAAISVVAEWLNVQIREGHGPTVMAALEKWIRTEGGK